MMQRTELPLGMMGKVVCSVPARSLLGTRGVSGRRLAVSKPACFSLYHPTDPKYEGIPERFGNRVEREGGSGE